MPICLLFFSMISKRSETTSWFSLIWKMTLLAKFSIRVAPGRICSMNKRTLRSYSGKKFTWRVYPSPKFFFKCNWVPMHLSLPRDIIPILEQRISASSIECVVKIMQRSFFCPFFFGFKSLSKTSQRCLLVSGSNPLHGEEIHRLRKKKKEKGKESGKRCWFVEENDLGVANEGNTDGKSSSHSSREVFRLSITVLRQADLLQDLENVLFLLFTGNSLQSCVEKESLGTGHFEPKSIKLRANAHNSVDLVHLLIDWESSDGCLSWSGRIQSR